MLLPNQFLYRDIPTGLLKADMIHVYHSLSVLFIYLGWVLIPSRFLWIYILYVGSTLLSWQLNTDICPTTQAEYTERGWDIQTTPGFTQMFLIRPLLGAFGYPANAPMETTLTKWALDLIQFFFVISFVRYGLYLYSLVDNP